MTDDTPEEAPDEPTIPPEIHVGDDEETRTGRFRLFRVLPAVPHLNLFDPESRRLYTVHGSNYRDDLQSRLDGFRTGDLLEGTLVGAPADPEAPWRLARAERDSDASVSLAFASDVAPEALPAAVRDDDELRERAATDPVGRTLEHDGHAVGEVWLQPRDPLPEDLFLPNVLAGLVPMEPWFERLPEVGDPAAEALVLDTAGPEATTFDQPFGVVVFLTEAGRDLGDHFRDRYGLPTDRTADTRPDMDPYT
jgi:hypothetical protein